MTSQINTRRYPYYKTALLALMITIISAIFYLTHVSTSITEADRQALDKIIPLTERSVPASYEQQIVQISTLQMAVFAASPGSRAIAFRQPREPSDLLNARSGQCFDRARTLDKALRFVGYQTRYVSIYKRPKGWSVLDVLLSPADRQSNEGVRSHAVVEVLTAQGWLFLDTVTPFISQDKAGKPISLAAWQNTRDKDQALWMPQAPPARLYPLLQSDFVQVVGLYSRHGMAYWPYVPLPDIDWFALPENI